MENSLVTDTQQHSVEDSDAPSINPETHSPSLNKWNQCTGFKYGEEDKKIPAAYYKGVPGDIQHKWSKPRMWTNFENAKWHGENVDNLDGFGFIIQSESKPYNSNPDPYSLIDFDDARNPETGKIHPYALHLIRKANSFAEVSVLMAGIHLLVIGKLPDDIGKIDMPLPEHPDFPDASIEVYDGGRFMALSGNHIEGTPLEINESQETIDEAVEDYREWKAEQTTEENNKESHTDDEREAVSVTGCNPGDKPDEWPECYYAGLKAREKAGNGELVDGSPHDVNWLTANLGVWAGFDDNEITQHFEDFYPPEEWDEEITRDAVDYQRKQIESGKCRNPPLKALTGAGILPEATCDCEIHNRPRHYLGMSRTPWGTLSRDELRQTSDKGIMVVSDALEDLHVASAKEIADETDYSPKQTYRILKSDTHLRRFNSVEIAGTSYWYGSLSPLGITEERLEELPITLSGVVQTLEAGRNYVDTPGKTEILDAVQEHGPSTASEMAEETNLSSKHTRNQMNNFTEVGLFEKSPRYGSTMEYSANSDLVA